MKVEILSINQNISEGDLLILEKDKIRLVVLDDVGYALLDLQNGEITTLWYKSINGLLEDISNKVIRVIPSNNLKLKEVE